MKYLFLALFLAGAADLRAFDTDLWLKTRAARIAEAGRLRAAYSNCLARATEPAENVTLPVETFRDGSLKTLVQAKQAQYFLEEGLVWAKGVTVKQFSPEGRVESLLEAESCLVDRKAKCGWAEGRAKVTHGKTVFTGRGVYFSSPEAYVRVFADSTIVSQDLKFGGVRP